MNGPNPSELCEELLSVAATIRDNGWHVAALKLEAAAGLIGRLQCDLVFAEETITTLSGALTSANATIAAQAARIAECVWDDCDQTAIYCAGHAREFMLPTIEQLQRELAAANERLPSEKLRHNCQMRAIERWQATHPGNDLHWPDGADLLVWLMDSVAVANARIYEMERALSYIAEFPGHVEIGANATSRYTSERLALSALSTPPVGDEHEDE